MRLHHLLILIYLRKSTMRFRLLQAVAKCEMAADNIVAWVAISTPIFGKIRMNSVLHLFFFYACTGLTVYLYHIIMNWNVLPIGCTSQCKTCRICNLLQLFKQFVRFFALCRIPMTSFDSREHSSLVLAFATMRACRRERNSETLLHLISWIPAV